MKIGILSAGHMPDAMLQTVGDYADLYSDMLAGHGFEFENFNVVDGEFPGSLEMCDGWLVSGSRHGAYDELDFIPLLENLIREIAEAGQPLLGICFGHQIIAQALGGKVVRFDGGWTVGRQLYDFAGQQLALNAWHQDQVVEVPDGARVIASSPTCMNAAILYGSRIFTVQPHPEFDAAEIAMLIQYRSEGIVPPELVDTAASQLDQPVDNELLADQFADFFRRAHGA